MSKIDQSMPQLIFTLSEKRRLTREYNPRASAALINNDNTDAAESINTHRTDKKHRKHRKIKSFFKSF